MSSLRAIATIAVPAVTALLGLLWYFGRRKQSAARRLVDPPDKHRKSKQTESGALDSPRAVNSSAIATDVEVSNGQASTGSINNQENPVSSSSAEKTNFQCCLPTEKGDNISSVTTAESSDLTGVNDEIDREIQHQSVAVEDVIRESKSTDLTGVNDEIDRDVQHQSVTLEDVIQESIVQPSFIKPCTSDRSIESEAAAVKLIGNDSTLEPAIAKQHEIEEPAITQTIKENVFTAPELSTSALEHTFTAEKSQELKVQDNSERNLSLSSSSLTKGDKCLLENEISNHSGQKNSEKEISLSIDLESEVVQQVDSFTGSWHEDLPENENNEDLTENVPNASTEKQNSSENLDSGKDLNSSENLDSSVVATGAADKVLKTEKVESDSSNLSVKSRTNEEIERLQPSPNSQSSLQNEKLSENNHSDSSSNCDNLSEASNDSGKGGSVQENTSTSPPDEDRLFEFNIPSDLCGLFIGTRGKTIKMISQQSGTKIRLQNNPYTRDFQICVIEGTQSNIETACNIIKRKFPVIKFPGMDLNPASNPVIMPEIMQLSLPEGVSVDIVVSSIVDAGRIFVQQPTHPTYPSLDRLNTFMNQCYMQEGAVPDIPRPIESGVICAAPMLNGWYRAQIMASHDGCDECDIKYVDYGGYSRVSSAVLKQIRSDFMTLPFEAVECYLANITPLENEQYFSTEAAVVLEELTQGKLLQGQVVGRADDGIPYVHVYQILGANSALLVNREMVNRGVVKWIELME